ncbi:MAG: ankyrin repeat domain-containing protein [Telluria sp.]|nr:ankyrin repeat domain-containing protein [Telluria sp.]
MTIQKPFACLLLSLVVLLSACSSQPARVAQFDRRLDLPLVLSIEQGKHDEALAMLERGADPNAADPVGRTALMYAGISGQTDTMELLIQRGARVNAKDREGVTPLHSAVMFGDPAAVRLLIDKGAELNAKFDMGGEMTGLTALKLARTRQRTAPELRSSDVLARGRLIYHSIKSDYEKIIEMLERAGAPE